MANPLFNALNNNNSIPKNPMLQLISDVNRMKQSFNGNPKDEVQRLLNSGQMSQQQFNQFAQIANQLMGSGAIK